MLSRLRSKYFMHETVTIVEKKLREFVSTPAGMIVQEFIEGPDSQMWVVNGYRSRDKDPTAMVTVSKVRQSGVGAGGVGIVCVTCRNERLIEITRDLLISLGYYGAFAIEFKYCAELKDFVFIEANYRTARIHVIGRRAGSDLPAVVYADVTGQEPFPPIAKVMGDGVWYYDVLSCWRNLFDMRNFGQMVGMARSPNGLPIPEDRMGCPFMG